MQVWWIALSLIPFVIFLHLRVSPYTKVEESFNIQAIHDILTFGIPTENIADAFKVHYDHTTFPGAVPRTFVGAIVLAGISRPFIWLYDAIDRQQLARGVLGIFNTTSLVIYTIGIRKTFGKTTALWYIALQASQFHVIYYASRTLPNMFAFGLTTIALRYLLPNPALEVKYVRLAIYLLAVAAVVFRSEIALLLASHIAFLLIKTPGGLKQQISLLRKVVIPAGLVGSIIALTISVLIDTFFWQSATPLWPELSAFISNIFPSGNSLGASAWGTSPWHWYFTSAIPRLLLNPSTFALLPFSLLPPAIRSSSLALLLPNLTYTALYSFLPHKETRFLFPIIPPLTTAVALAASYVSNRAQRSTIYRLSTYLLILSTLITTLLSHAFLLPLSALSYPGGAGLQSLQAYHLIRNAYEPHTGKLCVYISNLAAQTGVTRFLEDLSALSLPSTNSPNSTTPTSYRWIYDKSPLLTHLNPDPTTSPAFWDLFTYALLESPTLPPSSPQTGDWKVFFSVPSLGKPRLQRPGNPDPAHEVDVVEALYGAPLMNLYARIRSLLRDRLTRGYWIEWCVEEKLWVMGRSETARLDIVSAGADGR